MNCTFDKEKLTGYYDGELEAAEKAEVERHIASCSECLRELGELKSAALLVKELPRLRAPRSIADGVAREIQTAGKVHQFAKIRRTVLWSCAAAAAVLVALNVVYFVQGDRSPEAPLAAKATQTPSIANATPAPPAESAPETRSDPAARRMSQDRAREDSERGLREESRKFTDEPKKADQKAAAPVKEEPAPMKDKEKLAAAPDSKPAPAPPAAALPPAPSKPGAPSPVPAPAAKDEARPNDLPAEKAGAAKKDGDALAKQELELKKRSAEPAAEPAPTHLTLVSTQMAKDRTAMEASLKKMGVTLPAPAPTVKAMTKSARDESTISLELTDRQIARLQQELTKAGRAQLLYASPGDPVLQQYGDTGLLRGKVASGGAAAPAPRKTPEAPKAEAPKGAEAGKALEGKEVEEQAARAEADKAANEPKRKIVLHLLEVTFMPDPQPAADPVKK